MSAWHDFEPSYTWNSTGWSKEKCLTKEKKEQKWGEKKNKIWKEQMKHEKREKHQKTK